MPVLELQIVYSRAVAERGWHGHRLRNASEAADEFRPRLEPEAVEVFGVLALSTRHDSVGYHEVSRGCLSSPVVHPREVFKAAVLSNAAAIIVAHNHPSGDPVPSADDIELTLRLRAAGELLGIDLVDHIVIDHHGRYFSFRESGCL